MADKSIGELPQAQKVLPESLIPLEQDGQAMRMSGEQFADFAKESVSPLAQQAEDSANTANESARRAESARDSIEINEQKLNQAMNTAQTAANSAGAAQVAAESAKTAAETANTGAQSAQTVAQQAARDAQSAQTAAQTSATQAESAADRAENAATTVESIVAGNEAYTKRESDLRFAVPIVEVASGEVIAVTDSAERPLQGLKVFGKTIQDGTPTPDAPVELVSVGGDGSVEVGVLGKNLFDCRDVLDANTLNYLGDDDFITLSYDNTNGTKTIYMNYYTKPIKFLKPDTSYKLVTEVKSLTSKDSILYSATGYERESQFADKNIQVSNVGQTVSVVRTLGDMSGAMYSLRTFVKISSGGSMSVTFRLTLLPLDEEFVEYEPYKEQSMTISTPNGLPGLPVTSGGNYTDENGQQWICDEVDFARGVYVQRIKREVFTGNEKWVLFWSTPGMFCLNNAHLDTVASPPTEKHPDMLCNSFAIAGYGVLRANLGNVNYNAMASIVKDDMAMSSTFVFAHYDCTTTEDFKEFLSQKYENGTPVECLFVLAAPIETPLSAEELAQYAALHTNYPNTTVFNDADASMEVKYAADTKMYIDNKFAQLAAAIVNNT